MNSNEVYASLMQVSKDHSYKESVLLVVKSALEAHLKGDATVDLKEILDTINRGLTQNNK